MTLIFDRLTSKAYHCVALCVSKILNQVWGLYVCPLVPLPVYDILTLWPWPFKFWIYGTSWIQHYYQFWRWYECLSCVQLVPSIGYVMAWFYILLHLFISYGHFRVVGLRPGDLDFMTLKLTAHITCCVYLFTKYELSTPFHSWFICWLDMRINEKKSCCIRIGPRCDTVCACITTTDGHKLPWVKEIRYHSGGLYHAKQEIQMLP